MAQEFLKLPRMGFMGAEFPVERYRVKGGLRYHVHEYPHVPGGDIEKLGRKLYEIDATANFQSTMSQWPGLWPSRLNLLRSIFESGESGTLIIPSIGGLKCVATEWDQEFVAKVLSGERTEFKFIEDQESAFAFQKLVTIKVDSIPALSATVEAEFDRVGVPRPFTDELLATVNAVLAIADTAELYGMLLGAKIGMVASLCREFDQRIEQFQDPSNWAALEAMKDLWAATNELAGNVDGNAVTFAYYRVPVLMTIGDVATAIYGDTERATELLQLNPIENALAIQPDTQVRYVVNESLGQAA